MLSLNVIIEKQFKFHSQDFVFIYHSQRILSLTDNWIELHPAIRLRLTLPSSYLSSSRARPKSKGIRCLLIQKEKTLKCFSTTAGSTIWAVEILFNEKTWFKTNKVKQHWDGRNEHAVNNHKNIKSYLYFLISYIWLLLLHRLLLCSSKRKYEENIKEMIIVWNMRTIPFASLSKWREMEMKMKLSWR